jgi:hypothetical protein
MQLSEIEEALAKDVEENVEAANVKKKTCHACLS